MYLPNLKSVALPVPELIGGSQNYQKNWGGPVPGYAHTLYSPEKSYMHSLPYRLFHICALCTRFPAIYIVIDAVIVELAALIV